MRTAPVPNFAAIPGMNPGIFVLGGGGDGGGSGAGGGKGGKGKQGGDGKNGGKDANGGGKNGNACGQGSQGGCPNPQHGSGGTAAGDPVDVVTGRVYTVAVEDLYLPGPLPLLLTRSYSSDRTEDDVGLGPGWSHSLAWEVVARRRTVRVKPHGMTPIEALLPEEGGSVELPCGTLTRHAWGFTIDTEGLVRAFAERAEDGRHLLSRISDRHQNQILLFHEEGALRRVVDSAGREIRARRSQDGHIAAFEVQDPSGQAISFRTYQYDAEGRLDAATDGEGYSERFAYDEAGRLVRREEPGGLVAFFRYDDHGRCVETYCQRDGNDGLDEGLGDTLADGVSRARGFCHVRLEYGEGTTDVLTSRGSRRIDGNAQDGASKIVFAGGVNERETDGAGRLLSTTDALGGTWKLERDPAGRLLAAIDPLGAKTEYTYDERGFVRRIENAAGGASSHVHDDRGDLLSVDDALGPVASFSYDARGLLVEARLPNGGITRMAYDDLGNRVEIVEPDGSVRRTEHNFLGQPVKYTDGRGLVTSYQYDRCGRLLAMRSQAGAITSYSYDADGNLSRVVDPDGRATSLRWGGMRVVTELSRPDGSRVLYRHDREMDLVRVVNEAGQSHVFVRGAEGRVVEERTFDGRVIRYRHDLLGRVTHADRPDGTTEYTYDALGRLTSKVHPDDTREIYEYDAVGRLIRAETDEVAHAYTYDAGGRLVREDITHGGVTTTTEYGHDAMGRVCRVKGPAGVTEVTRDVMGRAVSIAYGDVAPIAITYEIGGEEVGRTLPGGGRITTELTTSGAPLRSTVTGARGARPRGSRDEPAWIAASGQDTTLDRYWTWSAGGFLQGIDDLAGRRRELLRDVLGRVDRVRENGKDVEVFAFSPAGDLHEPGAPRAYDPGGRIRSRGAHTSFVHDSAGRVIEKRVQDGVHTKVYSFEWRASGLLGAVRTPDGARVSFVYDAFARRLEKRVERDRAVVERTRYFWDGDVMVRELRERAGANGDAIVEERTYAAVPGSHLPLAHRDRVNGEDGPFKHYLYSPHGVPDALLEGDGSVAGELGASLYGSVAGGAKALSALRFPGQAEDAETGLFYNRYRYYDPETGTYLSPEPLGIEGSLNPYSYVDHYPLERVDVAGLDPRMDCTITRQNGLPPIDNRSGMNNPQNGRPRTIDDLHPAVRAALPPNNARGAGSSTPPHGCAEPWALTDHLNDWERRNAPNTCRPNDPNWQRNLQSALGEVNPNGGIASSQGGTPRASCPNCSQTIPRLWALAGQMPPTNVIAPGYNDGMRRRGPFGPTSPPAQDFSRNPANQMSNTNDYGQQNLGTWSHQGGQWRRSPTR